MDLNAPLGRKPPPPRPSRVVPIVLASVTAVALVGAGIYLMRADPHGGEPYAVAAIPPEPAPKPQPVPPTAAPDPMPTGSIAPPPAAADDQIRLENGVRVVSPSAGADTARRTGPLIIDVTKALDGGGLRKQDHTASTETLPKVVTGVPSAQSIPAARPRVAIFVGGLGLNEIATRTAMEVMPAAVDLAFVPYGTALTGSIDAARSRGHEILLQLPMKGAQGAAPGPHALSADESAAERTADLAWLTSRFDGYAGMTNLLGAQVTARTDAMTAILEAVRQRGAFYVDDGTSRRSTAPSLAPGLGVPVVQADVVLDATADPSVLRANLERLVAIAKAKGSAVGMASALSDHVAAVARFATELDGRGVTLVPVGAIARGGPSVATTR